MKRSENVSFYKWFNFLWPMTGQIYVRKGRLSVICSFFFDRKQYVCVKKQLSLRVGKKKAECAVSKRGVHYRNYNGVLHRTIHIAAASLRFFDTGAWFFLSVRFRSSNIFGYCELYRFGWVFPSILLVSHVFATMCVKNWNVFHQFSGFTQQNHAIFHKASSHTTK